MRPLLLSPRSGFTLIELLVVIVIIAILMAVAIPAYLAQQEKAKDSEARQYLQIAWRDARSAAIETSGFPTAALLAAEIGSSEPSLTVQTGTCTAAEALPAKTVVVATSTANSLVLCAPSRSGKVFRLSGTATGGASSAEFISYRRGVLAGDPLSYWRFSETSGASAADASGSGATASVTGARNSGTLLLDDIDPSVDFNGTTDSGSATISGLSSATQFSLEAWFNADVLTGQRFIGYARGTSANFGFWCNTDTLWIKCVWGTGTGGVGLDIMNNLATGTSYHLVFTHDGTTGKGYINGVLGDSDTGAYAPKNNGNLFTITGPGSGFFDGKIDEMAVYDRALTQAEVTAHYNAR